VPERSRILFVTGKLAEPALRRILGELAPRAGFEAEVAVLPISVAALLTTDWVARHLRIPSHVERVLLPGFCGGELGVIAKPHAAVVERGPKDLRDLPEHFGQTSGRPAGYGAFDIEIIAEINHISKFSVEELQREARKLRADGADIIDLGCDPGEPWPGVADMVRALTAEGLRVSIDSFNRAEVEAALDAGAELVLSVNNSNAASAKAWHEKYGAGVVAIPDFHDTYEASIQESPIKNQKWSDSLSRTIETLTRDAVPFRIDPILEPIGFGFAASLGRYIEVRQRYPEAEMMMGVGNLSELTDADSAAINVLLLGFCQELGIRSVLTTQVINWCRSCVKELDLARRLVHHAVREKIVPKRLEPNLVLLRDPKIYEMGETALRELAERLTDPNYRLFVERGELHILNGQLYVHGTDPFALFAELLQRDPKLDPSHSFYLGYELGKAVTALTLGKNYTQDQALRWGFLTVPENEVQRSSPP
jgi:dihydropteroate synthase-like protein